MNKKTKLSYLIVIVFALALSLTSLVAVAKNESAKNDNSNKTSQSQVKGKDKTVNLKSFEKPDKTKGQTNAQVHEEKIEKVNEKLGEVSDQEESQGNTEISDQIDQVVTEQEQSQGETVAAIEEVESRGKIKTFLVGTDYKNLGQLRSSLVQNRNQIRKLTRTMSQVQNEGDQTLLQEQLETLMQERERIKEVITTNQDSFSLFGWVTRFLTNYEETPINQQEEEDLTEEVEEAIDDANENQETTEGTDITNTTETTTP